MADIQSAMAKIRRGKKEEEEEEERKKKKPQDENITVCPIPQGDHNKLARVVAAKLEDGNIRAAGRILSPAQPSLDGPAKLQTLTCRFVLL